MAEIEDSLPNNNLIENKLRVGEYVSCRNGRCSILQEEKTSQVKKEGEEKIIQWVLLFEYISFSDF